MKDYLNNDYKFDKLTLICIVCLIIVISGISGWLYEFIFYFFNSGMTQFTIEVVIFYLGLTYMLSEL